MLNHAIEIAKSNPIKPRGRNSISRFAAILSNGRQSFYGLNKYKTHPLQSKFGSNPECIYLHAELDAIIRAINFRARYEGKRYLSLDICDLSDFDMYIARVLKDGTPAIAKPCEGCMKAIEHFNVRSVQWTM